MSLLGIFMVLYALAITPLHLRVDMAAGSHVTGAIVLHVWGIRLQANVGFERDEQKRLNLSFHFEGSPKRHSGNISDTWQGFLRVIRIIKETNITRALFTKTIQILHIGVETRIGFSNAAYTALIAGSVKIVMDILRERLRARGVHHNLQAWPDFQGNPCAIALSCILFIRLGNLLLGCTLVGIAALVARRREKKTSSEEERAWSTPSET